MSDIYIVMFINMLVWVGIFGYMVHLHSKIKKLKDKILELKK